MLHQCLLPCLGLLPAVRMHGYAGDERCHAEVHDKPELQWGRSPDICALIVHLSSQPAQSRQDAEPSGVAAAMQDSRPKQPAPMWDCSGINQALLLGETMPRVGSLSAAPGGTVWRAGLRPRASSHPCDPLGRVQGGRMLSCGRHGRNLRYKWTISCRKFSGCDQ